jgi:hypothetical protein
MIKLLCVLVASLGLLGAAGCSEDPTYAFRDVPYCKPSEGESGEAEFERDFGVVAVANTSGFGYPSESTIVGEAQDWSGAENAPPKIANVKADSYRVAVVACGGEDRIGWLTGSQAIFAEVTDNDVPTFCGDQEVVAGPTKVEAQKVDHDRVDIAVPFPEIDDQWLTCENGELARWEFAVPEDG